MKSTLYSFLAIIGISCLGAMPILADESTGDNTSDLQDDEEFVINGITYQYHDSIKSKGADNTEITVYNPHLSVKELGEELKKATSITIDENVEYKGHTYHVQDIAKNSFLNFTNLEHLTLPNSVLRMHVNACEGCTNLTSVTFTGGTPKLQEIDANVFKNCTKLSELPYFPDLEMADTCAFYNSGLKSFEGGPQLNYLGPNAFQGCKSLTDVNIAQCVKMTSIQNSTFQGCPSLTSFDFGDTAITNINADAFEGDSSLRDLNFPKVLNNINTSAFQNCNSLTNIDLQNTNVQYISANAFAYCPSIKQVVFPASYDASNGSYQGDAFAGDNNIQSVIAYGATAGYAATNLFTPTVYENAHFYYPNGELGEYSYDNKTGYNRADSCWWQFQHKYKNVITGVEDLPSDEAADLSAPVKYYSLTGTEVLNPTKGQLLIKLQGSRTEKIIY